MEVEQSQRQINNKNNQNNSQTKIQSQQNKITQPVMDNQSNLLQSKVFNNPTSSFDQQPIGGGNKKFNFSQYPQEGESFKPPPPKKNINKKAPKKPLANNQQLPSNENNITNQISSKVFNQDAPIPKLSQPLDQLPVGGNKNNQFGSEFDQKPIGKSNFNMSEFPQGQQQPQQQKQYPMLQKLKSKAAKLRLSGMQDLLKLLQQSPDHPDINQIDVKALVKQTTPANLDKGLQVLKVWIQKGRKWGDQQTKNAIQNGMAKPNTKKITIQICDLMYQQNITAVQTAILLGMKGKIAKNIAYYLTILRSLLEIYGINRMKFLKPYLSQIIKLLNQKKDTAIKTEGTQILKQAYKWLGKDVISPQLGQLNANIKKVIDQFWDTYDQSIVMKAPKGQQEAQSGDGKKKKKIDAYQLSQAVDVFKKFNEKWSQGVLEAPKWNQKTKMLQEFVKAASVPKLANTQFRHISQMIKRLINDSNFNVVIWDLKVLAVMSRGLRRNFQYVVKNIFANVLGKFRDKKTQMIQQTFNTLNDFLYCISVQEVLDDVKEGLQDKAPNMKVNVINWIGKFVQLKNQQKGQIPKNALDAIKQLFPIFQKLLNDGNVQVRNCMAAGIFKMKLVTGDEFFAPIQAKMNKNLASKVSDPKTGSGKQSSKKQKTPQKPKQDLSKSAVNFNKPGKDTQKNQMMKTQAMGKKQQPKQNKKAQQPELVLQKFEQPSFDDSCQKLLQYGFPQDQIKNIKASGAKQRTNVMNLLKAESYDLLTTFMIMRQLFKDWKQVNLVMNKQLIAFIQAKSNQIDKPQLIIIIPFIIQKIGDSKFSPSLYKALQNICQKIPGIFVVGYFIQKIKALDNKKPKLNGDVCDCISKIIDIVSVNNIPVRQTILFANQCYKIQFCKKGGVDLIKKIYSYIGQQTKIYLQAQTYTALQGQLKKMKILTEQQKRPKVQFSGQAKKTEKKTVNLLQNKPKVDITQKVQDLLPKMNDNGNWQNRKQSAQAIMALVSDNFGRVTIGCMNDLMNNLKIRINDPNKNNIKSFMQLTGVLFPVLSDKDLKVFTKMFITTLADGLSDKMQVNRKQAANTLNKIGQVVGKQLLLSTLAPYLQTDKESRVQIIAIMLSNQQFLQKTDMKDFPKGITNCLCDKNKQIRNLGQKLFQKVYQRIGIDTFRNIAKNQKPALTKDLNAIYDKYDSKRQSISASIGSQSNISKASSPSKDTKPSTMDRRIPPPTNSAKKRSLSKNHQKSTIQMEVQQPQYTTNNKSRIQEMPQQKIVHQSMATLVEGDQYFAPIKYLTLYRVDRQQHNSHFSLQQLSDQQQDNLKEQISLLINPNLVKKMFSFNQKRVSDAVLQLIKLCKEITYQSQFRQLYDLLLKWTLLRLWGGSPGLLPIIEVFPPILSILQKKKLSLNDFQVDLIIAVVRQYLISAYITEFKVSDSIHIIIKSLVTLSSGQRVAKKILRQFSYQLTAIHRHLKKQVNVYYRDGLSRLTKMHLMDFIGNQDTLQETSKIKQLRSDPQFVDMLYRKFHQTVLNHFGFRNYVQANLNNNQLPQNNFMNASQLHQTMPQNNQPPLPPTNIMVATHSVLPRRQRSLSNESRKRQKSVERQPNMGKRQTNNSRVQLDANNTSTISNKPKPNQTTTVNTNQYQQPSRVNAPPQITQTQTVNPTYPQQQVNTSSSSSQFLSQGNSNSAASSRAHQQNDPFSSYQQSTMMNRKPQQHVQQSTVITSQDINLSIYPAPHPISPLGKNLSKLLPPNDQTIKFFSELFGQNGQKISNELITHSKMIYGSILKSVMQIMQNRQQYSPDKIVNQLNLFQQCIKCKNIIRNIDLQLLKIGVNFTIRQLVYEDQNKGLIQQDLVSRGIQYRVQNFIKVINGVMLRILQNGNPKDVVNTLIMINNQLMRMPQRTNKTVYLIMKCTHRVAQSFTAEQQNSQKIVTFFTAVNQYFAIDPPTTSLQQFSLPTNEKPKPQHNFLASIKGIITQLCKILGADIWQHYDKFMQQAKYQDSYIAPYIQSMKIPKYSQKPSMKRNNQRDDEQIKKISDLLSKTKTFETGIVQLKKYCQMNPDFDPIQYFTSLGYDQKFNNMVMNALEGRQRRTPRKDNKQGSQYAKSKSPIGNPNVVSQQQNIQEKIKKLKQKFEQIQPSHIESQPYQDLSANKSGGPQQIRNEKQDRQLQIKRRIDEMKNKMLQNPNPR